MLANPQRRHRGRLPEQDLQPSGAWSRTLWPRYTNKSRQCTVRASANRPPCVLEERIKSVAIPRRILSRSILYVRRAVRKLHRWLRSLSSQRFPRCRAQAVQIGGCNACRCPPSQHLPFSRNFLRPCVNFGRRRYAKGTLAIAAGQGGRADRDVAAVPDAPMRVGPDF